MTASQYKRIKKRILEAQRMAEEAHRIYRQAYPDPSSYRQDRELAVIIDQLHLATKRAHDDLDRKEHDEKRHARLVAEALADESGLTDEQVQVYRSHLPSVGRVVAKAIAESYLDSGPLYEITIGTGTDQRTIRVPDTDPRLERMEGRRVR